MTEFDKLKKMVVEDNEKALEIMVAKNHDYSGENPDDPMANFNLVESVLGLSAEMGQMVRILDKLSRIANFIKTGVTKVADEKTEDTILDMINYLRLLKFRMQQRREAKEGLTYTMPDGFGSEPGKIYLNEQETMIWNTILESKRPLDVSCWLYSINSICINNMVAQGLLNCSDNKYYINSEMEDRVVPMEMGSEKSN